jgi:hypothetical protein
VPFTVTSSPVDEGTVEIEILDEALEQPRDSNELSAESEV